MIDLVPNEAHIAEIRRHWLVFVLESVGIFIAAFAPFLLFPAYRLLPLQIQVFSLDQDFALALFLYAAWLLLLLMAFFTYFTNYYLDVLIVTNKRLIDVEQLSLFARDVAVASLENVEDVKVEVLGFLSTIFRFGNLHIQTAAVEREIVIRGIHHPERARDIIMHALEEAKVSKQTP